MACKVQFSFAGIERQQHQACCCAADLYRNLDDLGVQKEVEPGVELPQFGRADELIKQMVNKK